MGESLFDYVLEVASGRPVKAEEAGFHDMAIFQTGCDSVTIDEYDFQKG